VYGFGLAESYPANPVARVFKETADDSPSPWGEGRDEGGGEPFEFRIPQFKICACHGSFPEFILGWTIGAIGG
jgi:hypothetical protein